jgi:hypothetical protein
MAKWMTKAVLAIFLVFLACQVVRPARTNPAVEPSKTIEAHVEVPPNVDAIFTRACDNCHSNRTTWPWYSNVAPVSWLVTNDVNEARQHLNFSDWEARHHHEESPFDEMCKQLRDGDMPPATYRMMHPEAHLTPADVETVCAWTAGPPKER